MGNRVSYEVEYRAYYNSAPHFGNWTPWQTVKSKRAAETLTRGIKTCCVRVFRVEFKRTLLSPFATKKARRG